MEKLVIVESPAKAKTIQKYLGKGYTVKASKGHVVDLPKSGLAVDTEKDYEPTYEVTKPTVVRDLKKALKDADTLVIASDPDREGEAIGWHVAVELGLLDRKGKKKGKKGLERIVFTEITKDAVQKAAANPREIDVNLLNAQQARRVLDRLVGYKLSPLLWKKIRFGLSAGRVQSVAVRLIVDRERERDAFKPDEYWKIKADIDDKPVNKVIEEIRLKEGGEAQEDEDEDKTQDLDTQLLFELTKFKGKKPEIDSQKKAEAITDQLKKEDWIVESIASKEVKKNPNPPFSTSTLQQSAINKLGFSARRTMQAAQKIYEAGHITYMRTDSISMSSQAIEAVRKQIVSKYGKEYLPQKPNLYKTKSKVAQEAHEAVRPTDFTKNASALGLTGDEAKVYGLIFDRAVASQMEPARMEQNTITIAAGDYLLTLTGRKIKFHGYLKAYHENIQELDLPKMEEGSQVYPKYLLSTQHFTQPPARYSEASLIKVLESLGIGRPSTYAPIIHTIQLRKYVEKDGRYFFPTDTGIVVTDLLVKYFGDIVDAGFTAGMEDKLDDIANGDLDWIKMLDKFYKPFEKELVENENKISRDEFTVLEDAPSDIKCPDCGKKMIVKLGRYGRFYSCSNFPDCKGMRSMTGETEDDIAEKAKSKEFLEEYKPAPKTKDGKDFILKRGRFGEFWAHPDYPKVKEAIPLELTDEKQEAIYGKPPLTDDKRPYLLKSGKFGKFWAHPDYPKVKDIIKVKKPEAKAESE